MSGLKPLCLYYFILLRRFSGYASKYRLKKKRPHPTFGHPLTRRGMVEWMLRVKCILYKEKATPKEWTVSNPRQTMCNRGGMRTTPKPQPRSGLNYNRQNPQKTTISRNIPQNPVFVFISRSIFVNSFIQPFGYYVLFWVFV